MLAPKHVVLPRRVAAAGLMALALASASSTAAAAPVVHLDEASFLAASDALASEDFEQAPWIADTNHAGPVTHLGVTWHAADTLRSTTFMPHGGAVALSDLDGNPDQLDTLTAELSGTVTAFGLWLRSTQLLVNVEFSIDADDGAPLANFAETFGDTWRFIGFTSETGFGRIEMRATQSGGRFVDDFMIDDVRFGLAATQPLPEPSTLVLAALGLAAATRSRVRNRPERRPTPLE